MIDLALLREEALGTSVTVRLSTDSLALLLDTEQWTTDHEQWLNSDNDDERPTDAEFDEIDALTAKALKELMLEVGGGMIGTIFAVVTASIPTGALECDGATYLRVDYPELYAALDTAFITDADHFVTPDLQGRTILGAGSGSGLSTYNPDDSGGAESHELTTAELASHAHTVNDTGHNHTATDAGHGHSTTNPTHTHGTTDAGHIHTVTETAHTHTVRGSAAVGVLSGGGTNVANFTNVQSASQSTGLSVNNNTTGLTINAAAANQTVNNGTAIITVASHVTGVTLQNAGLGTAHENRQPYRALRYALWAS